MRQMVGAKSLRVCFFSHDAAYGGADLVLLELVRELVEDYGVTCSVVVPRDGPFAEEYAKSGACVITIPYYWWCSSIKLSRDISYMRLHESYKMLLKELYKLQEIDPEIFVSNTLTIPWGAIAAKLFKKPHVWYVHEFGRLGLDLNFYVPFNRMLNIVNESSNLILTCSNAVKSTLFEAQSVTDSETVYCHIDIQNKQYGVATRAFSYPDALKLIILGAITEMKGQKDAVLAVNELIARKHNVELIIMGDGDPAYIYELKKTIRSNKLESNVKIYSAAKNPFPVLNQADVVLVCSNYEGFGRVTLEAFLLKKPVIGSNSAGTSELIRDGFNGLLYERGDHVQLADRIEYFIQQHDKINELGENAYKYAKNVFTKENFGGKVYTLFMSLRDSKNPESALLSEFETMVKSSQKSSRNFLKPELYLFPIGTRRRRFYDFVLIAFNIVAKEGLFSFLTRIKKYSHKLSRQL